MTVSLPGYPADRVQHMMSGFFDEDWMWHETWNAYDYEIYQMHGNGD